MTDRARAARPGGAPDLRGAASVERKASSGKRRVSELGLFDEVERRQILVEWNDTAQPLPPVGGVHELVAAQARRGPDVTAVSFADERLSYGELEVRANRLAHHLQAQGVGPEVVVGLCLGRSIDMVVAPLAVLKAGGAYLPLDPHYPAERLAFMLGDSRASVLVGHREHLDVLPVQRTRLLALDDSATTAAIGAAPAGPCPGATLPDQLAYVIYTSGSSGRPKAVMLTHRGAVNLVEAQRRFFGVEAGEVALGFAPYSFDAATAEIFVALGAGATLCVAPEPARVGPDVLAQLVRDAGVRVATFPPSFLEMLDPADLAGLETVISAGEPLSAELASVWRPRCRLVNAYGPTETTVCAALALCEPDVAASPGLDTQTPPIGGPMTNVRLYVVDGRMGPVPMGAPGELLVGGVGIARGYKGQPALTAERFVADPFGEAGGRLYRTGDRVRRRAGGQRPGGQRAGGELEFVGRLDDQVKVSGYRIEPGEIEARLMAHPRVVRAVVVARGDGPDRRLVAYATPRDVVEGLGSVGELRSFLSTELPEHMVPASFVELDTFPLNPNGKIDRAALPEPDGARPVLATGFVEPRTANEKLLAGVWAEVMGLEAVGVEDNFFELGGRSLVATQVVSRVRTVFGVELALSELFTNPTVAELARVVEAAAGGSGRGTKMPPEITAGERPDAIPLSFAQQRLWFLDQLDPGSVEYVVPGGLRLDGELDPDALRAAFAALVERHEVLRTRLVATDGVPYQVIDPPGATALEIVDVSDQPDPAGRAEELLAEDSATPFDLSAGPLLRARLIRIGPESHVLSLTMHHVVSDDWSARLLRRELSQLYEAFCTGQPAPLAPLEVQYADFAVWQRGWLQGGVLEAQLDHWRERLASAPVLELPSDRPRPAVRSSAGAAVDFTVPSPVADGLQSLSRDTGATMFMTTLAAFAVLLGRYACQHDVVVGTPIANRNRTETEGLVGFFINTLVLRTDLSGDPRFAEVVTRVRDAALDAYGHQDLPFEQLVDALQPERDRSRTPLFQVMFNYDEGAAEAGGRDELALQLPVTVATAPLEAPATTSKFDMTLFLGHDPEGLGGSLEYSTELFDRTTIERMAVHLAGLLHAVADDPTRRLSELSPLDDDEHQQVTVACNDTATGPEPAAGVLDLVAAQVVRDPEADAVVFQGTSLNYAELDARANQLSHHLRGRGVGQEGQEVVVGLCLDRGVDLVVGLLAVLKAGGVALPLDPGFPTDRLGFMLVDSGAAVVVGHGAQRERLVEASDRVDRVWLDDPDTMASIDAEPTTAPEVAVDPRQLAYVMYTSGSTGRPKGVMATHGGLANRLVWMQDAYGLDPRDRVLHKTPSTFDVSLWELLWPLTAGAGLVLAAPGRQGDVGYLVSLMEEQRVSVAHFVPSLFASFVSETVDRAPSHGLRHLRLVVCSGEALGGADVARFHAAHETAVVENLYGPTEASIDVSSWRCERDGVADRRPPPIGRPIANTQLYVLGDAMAPLPVGLPGELFIGGVGLARGYAGRAALTAERFVADPFAAAPGSRLYRTGDRVRRRPGLEIEFLGRLDDQVKLRGFRIEPGEIEAALETHPAIASAVVVLRDEVLVAYVVATDPTVGLPSRDELRAFLGGSLPEYMVPWAFVELAAIPLTPNGKLDRAALPVPDMARSDGDSELVAASTPTEQLLAGLWRELLGVDGLGVHDNFFAVGGHSLLATQLVSRLRSVFGVELALAELFDHPTVAALARVVDETARGETAPPITPVERTRSTTIPLSFAQQRLWFLDQLETGSVDYNVPAPLRLEGPLDLDALDQALAATVERHEVLRTRLEASEGVPHQVIDPPASGFGLEIVDVGDEPDPSGRAEALVAADAAQPFDLATGPLFRGRLIRVAADDHVLSLVMHHVVSDEWSAGLLVRELAELYDAFRNGKPSPLAPLPVQYADFAVWQRAWLQGDVLEEQLAYWRQRLAAAAALDLPTDRPRPAVRSSAGATLGFEVPAETTAALRQLSGETSSTMYMVVLAGFSALLGAYAGQDDVVVGTPVANRNRAEIEGLLGFFVNTLVLRTDLSGDPTFAELVARVRREALGAYAHQDLPFEHLVEELQPERDRSRTPLFQVMLSYGEGDGEGDGGEDDPGPRSADGAALFDLTFVLSDDRDGGLSGAVQYSTELFDQATVQGLADGLIALLDGVARDGQRRLSELSLVAEPERRRLVTAGNGASLDTAATIEAATGLASTDGTGVHGLLAAQAAHDPEATALVVADQSLSYGQMDARANQLAHHLRSLGVGPETVVGLCFERSAACDMVIALLGVLKAGGAYLPLDPDYPQERLAFMLADSDVAVLVGHGAQVESLADLVEQVVALDDPETQAAIAAQSADAPAVQLDADGLACVIYTSGSTGRPKGAAVTHGGLLGVLAGWLEAHLPPEPGLRWLSMASFGFDVFTGDLVRALCTGGTLVIGREQLVASVDDLARTLVEDRVNAFECAPRFVDSLVDHLAANGRRPDDLRLLVVTTDTWRASGAARAREVLGPDVRLLTAFGLTETTIDSACSDLARDRDLDAVADAADRPTPIGLPLANATTYVLNPHMAVAPGGAVGELHVGGVGLARGYSGRAALTAELFVADPLAADGSRVYRTGDRARWRSDGQLEFLGRLDDQVNLRGYRIEPGEVEATLAAHPAVTTSVVVACELPEATGGDRSLVGYVVPADPAVGVPPADELRRWLGEQLPDFMVPGIFVELAEVPVTPNGKLDRAALPAPPSDRPELTEQFVEPRTDTEDLLAGVWSEVLHTDDIGVHDNFFDLGGHSLLATQVLARLRDVVDVELGLAALFDHPTVAGLATVVEGSSSGRSAPPIVPVDRDGAPIPLSFAQQRLWFLDQLAPGSTEYNMPLALRLEGPLDVGALEAALAAVVERHEVLRTRLVAAEGGAWQVVDPAGFDLELVDLTAERDGWARAEQLLAEDAATPFDFAAGPLFRACLLRVAAEDHVLSVVLHHAAGDEWSIGILRRELMVLYDAFSRGEPSSLPPLAVQYADFAVWQREWLQGDVLDEQLLYWRDCLQDLPTLDLATDRPRPAVRDSAGDAVQFDVSEAVVEGLRGLSHDTGATMFMTTLAAYAVLLGRYAGQDDVVVGTPIANRNQAEIEDLVGLFVNTLVMRTDLSGDTSFAEVVARVRRQALDAFGHQDMPFEQLVDLLGTDRDRSRTPLFQVLFNYEQAEDEDPDGEPEGDDAAEALPVAPVAKFDLRLILVEQGDRLGGAFEFATALFDRSTVERMAGHLVRLLEQVADDPGRRLAELSLLGESERDELMVHGNGTETPLSGQPAVHEVVADQARRVPDAPAVTFCDESLTYAGLEAKANRMAHYLRSLGVGPEVTVGLCLERGIDMVVALLGVLKAGSAYVPMDPGHPPQRLGFMLDDAAVSVLIGRAGALDSLPATRARVVDLDDPTTRGSLAGRSEQPPPAASIHPDQLAYVIYTSGSTGVPKGVQVTHGALAAYVVGVVERLGFAGGRNFGLLQAPVVDFANTMLFGALATGGSLHIADDEATTDPVGLARFVGDHAIDYLKMVPSHLAALAGESGFDAQLPAEALVLGGEASTAPWARRLVDAAGERSVFNHYGPTETTVGVATCRIDSAVLDGTDSVAIGRPLPNSVLYVLDGSMGLVPVGVRGELCVGGVGLARGYGGRPALTAERFVANPFAGDGSRLYRTGDRSRWRGDGQVEFLGRVDHQLKVRGFRVEPAEVEAVVVGHPQIAASVVTGYNGGLVAHVVAADVSVGVPGVEDLRAHLARQLPPHMVPGTIVELERLPLLANGKLDRSALRVEGQLRPESSGGFVAPRTATENVVAVLWGELLSVGRVGVEDSFFELGGHSLLATQMVSRLRGVFGVELSVAELFDHPTVAGLAELIDTAGRGSASPPIVPVERDGGPLPLSFAQQRLWFLDQLAPGSVEYNIPALLHLEGEVDTDALGRAIDALVERHEVLRTRLVEIDGAACQVIDPPEPGQLHVVDVRDHPDPAARAEVVVEQDAAAPFDLATGPLFRARLVRIADDEHVLSVVMHHVISDEWSAGVLRRELSELYEAFSCGEPSPLAQLPVQYADFAVWQRNWLRGDVLQEQLEYWRKCLADLPTLDVPTDRVRPPIRSNAGEAILFKVPRATMEGLRSLAAWSGATTFMTTLAAYAVLLGRNAGQDDVIVGTPIANRNRTEIEDLIGFFVNTLVMRTDLSGDPTFAEVVDRVRHQALGAYAHQDLPFEQLVDALGTDRDRSRTPVCQVFFNYSSEQTRMADVAASDGQGPLTATTTIAKFDLQLVLTEHSDGLGGAFEFATTLFDRSTVERMVRQLVRLLEQVADDPGRRLSQLSWLDEHDQQMLAEWTGDGSTSSQPPVHEQVSDHADRVPAALAVTGALESLTYADLETRSNRVAHYLRGLGVGPEVTVGLCLERGIDMVVALLGVLKAGGAYLVLDPGHPAERLGFMLSDARASLLLGETEALDRLPAQRARVVYLDIPDTQATIEAQPTERLAGSVSPDQLAYVVYTSGSTGVPKGVQVTHGALAAYTRAVVDRLAFEAGRFGLLQSPVVDFANTMLFGALATAGSLHIADPEAATDAELLRAWLAANRIDYLKIVPSHLAALAGETGFEALLPVNTLVLGGEASPAGWTQELLDAVGERSLFNHYGPSETTVGVIAGRLSADSCVSANAALGSPLSHSRCYVLDGSMGLEPVGVRGELCVGGAGLARGYRGRPAMTAERFVADPYAGDGSRLYRTGDRARWRADGQVEFLGRMDDQLKVRGFRVEPAEVEAVLASHPQLAAAVVTSHEGGLAAHAVAADAVAGIPPAAVLRAFMRERLPEPMVPGLFAELERLPLLPNGKLDRSALAAPDGLRAESSGGYLPPRTATEDVLEGLWAEVLGVARVGVEDNFFDLGGHSLLATQLVSRLRGALEVELSVAGLFDHPTVAELAELIDRSSPAVAAPPIVALDRDGSPLPLSFAQQRLWFLDQLAPGSADYNIPALWRLEGEVDIGALSRAIDTLVERHEVLRTRLIEDDGAVAQVIDPPEPGQLDVVDLRVDSDPLGRAQMLVEQDAAAPFDLAAGPLFRARLVRIADEDHVLSMVMHHVISDEWSAGVLRRDLSVLYEAFRRAEPSPLAPLPVQYADFAVWQRNLLQGDVLETQLTYWRDQLDGAATLDLPTDRPRPPVRSSAGAMVDVVVPDSTVEGLRKVAHEAGATMFMTVLAGFKLLLASYAAQDDVVVGTPIANRNRDEIEDVIGCFINTLVLRTNLSGDPNFAEVVGRVRGRTLGALAHQDLPFEQVVDALQPERDRSRTPLFQVLFNYTQGEASPSKAEPESSDPARQEPQAGDDDSVAKFDLRLAMADEGGRVTGALVYSTDLFDRSTVERMARHLLHILAQVAEGPGQHLSELTVLDEREQQMLAQWNDTKMPLSGEPAIHELVSEHAAQSPEVLAARFGGESLTYGELDAKANRMAHYLRGLGVGPEVRVGLCLDRGLDMVVALLGVLKAGGAYLPLDPGFPALRLGFMVDNAAVSVLVGRSDVLDSLPASRAVVVDLDDPATTAGLAAQPDHGLAASPLPDQLAYLIYTSGSTGVPKGVQVTHGALAAYVTGAVKRLGLAGGRHYGLLQSPVVDFANTMLFGALATGGTLHIADPEVATDPELLSTWLAVNRIDYLKIVPSHLAALAGDTGFEGLLPADTLVLGGEASAAPWARGLVDTAEEQQIFNHYGPTETTVGVATCLIDADVLDGDGNVPIGRPLPNSVLYVLDHRLAAVPVGVVGELAIGGAGLARGYAGQPALTAERFVADLLAADGSRMYRSGDRARWRSDGRIEFLGRMDDQLKVRGYRIEPGEIETVLATHPQVATSVVVARNAGLVAYIVPSDSAEGVPLSDDMWAFAAKSLPEYMVPASYVPLDELPLTTAGKVDRAALPAPERSGPVATGGFLAPVTPTEQDLADVWADVLELEQVGVEDNFFDLGGHSLLVTRAVALARTGGYDLSVTDFYDAPTISSLARRVTRRESLEAPQAGSSVAIRRGMTRPVVFCVHEVGGGASEFHELASWLNHDQQLFGLQSRGLFDDAAPAETVEQMASAYIEEVLAIQPDGPYLLSGVSMGAYVALEMAYQLGDRGKQIGAVVMLGAPKPNPGIRRGKSTDFRLREALSEQVDLALQGPPGTSLPTLYEHWFMKEWPLSADEVARLQAGDKAMLRLVRVVETNRQASLRYQSTLDRRHRTKFRHRPKPYRERVVLFLPEDGRAESNQAAVDRWSAVLGTDPEVQMAPGNHYSIIKGSGAEVMGKFLAAEVDRLAL